MSKELLKLNALQLQQKAGELKKKLTQIRFDKATGKIIDTAYPSKTKKEIARVLTQLNAIKALKGKENE